MIKYNSDMFLITEICDALEIDVNYFLLNQRQRYVLGRYLFAFFAKKINKSRTLQSIGDALSTCTIQRFYTLLKQSEYLSVESAKAAFRSSNMSDLYKSDKGLEILNVIENN